LAGTFPFTLNISGSDGSGAYSIEETGTVTIDINPDANGDDITTGSITITSQFHRGSGGVTSADPSTTQTQSFDPTGTGLLLGFDIDGFNANQYSESVGNATSYSLTVSGSDTYSTTDSESDDFTSPYSGATVTDNIQGSDNGSDTLSLTITGPGSARTYVLSDTTVDNYNYTENDSRQLQNGTDSDSDALQSSDNGNETITDHEQGTIDSSGQMQATSFNVTDQSNDTIHATDTIADQNNDTDQTTDNSTETDNDISTQTIAISGAPASWTGTVSQQDNDNMTLTDQGTDDSQSYSYSGLTTNDEQWTANDSGPIQDTLQASVSGDDQGDVSVQNVNATLTANIAENTTDSDQATLTANDPSSETVTDTDHGTDQVDLTLNSPNGSSGTVTETENLTDNTVDTDSGNDAWNDPSVDPTTGQPNGGTDVGSDQYSESDSGSDSGTLNTSAAFDASGNLSNVAFSGNITGTATVSSSDSGSDTVAVGSETDVDPYTDSGTAGDAYSVQVNNSSGATIATINSTITDNQASTDTPTDTWSS
jgi:hypothetical protein